MALLKSVMLRNCTHLSEARYAAGMNVDYIGFKFSTHDSDDYRTAILGIFNWLAGVDFVAEIAEADQELVNIISKEYSPSVWMVSGKVLPLLPTDAQVVLLEEPTKEDNRVIGVLTDYTSTILSSLPKWFLKREQDDLELILPAADVLVLEGTPEERPGFADLDHLADVLEALEVED